MNSETIHVDSQVSNRWVQKLTHLVIVLICLSATSLLMTSCKSSESEDDVSPQSINNGEYFSKCKASGYTCYGNTANLASIEHDHKGTASYIFFLAMKVNNEPYNDLAVTISLSSFSGKGKYVLTTSNTEVLHVQRLAGAAPYSSSKVVGTMDVTDYQAKKYVVGSFALKSTDGTYDIELKEGEFKVKADF